MNLTLKNKLKVFLGLTLLLLAQTIFAQSYPDKPKTQKPVYDYADMLSDSEESRLNQKLTTYADTTSTQIVVLTVKSLNGIDIAMYGTELAQRWGIGQKGKDNGVLLLISKQDRDISIRTGYGTEATLTDALSRRIIEQVIKPDFKNDDFYGGINRGTDAMILALQGEFKGTPQRRGSGDQGKGNALGIIIFIVILVLIFSRNNKGGRGGGKRGVAGDILTAIILSNMGGRRSSGFGGGGFGGGGGGFGGGFGGGGFGGGGASGSW